MNSAATEKPGSVATKTRRKPQARSLERKRAILAATRELMETTSINNLSLYQIADRAGIPPSSLYHFFPKLENLLGALVEEIFVAFDSLLDEPLDPESIHHWTDITRVLQSRFVEYYRQHKYVRDLILGQHIISNIHHADFIHDDLLGIKTREHHQKLFHLPTLPDNYNIFAIALQVADKVYALSYQEFGNITDTMAREGRRAAQAYLGLYIPDIVPRKI